MTGGPRLPGVWIHIVCKIIVGRDLVMTPRVTGWAHNASIVSAIR